MCFKRPIQLVFGLGIVLAFFSTEAVALRIEPFFPELAREHCIEGKLETLFWINAEGIPKDIIILSSVPPEIFDEATIKNLARFYLPEKIGQFVYRTVEYKLESCRPTTHNSSLKQTGLWPAA